MWWPFLLLAATVFGDEINVTDPAFKQLPAIFRIDDDVRCRNEAKTYCKLSIKVRPVNSKEKSTHWNVIKATIDHPKFYNHNELFHAICIQDFCPATRQQDTIQDINDKLAHCYYQAYKHLGLRFTVNHLNCSGPANTYSPGPLDIVVLMIVLVYLAMVFYVTYLDKSSSNISKMTTIFSLKSNWNKLCTFNDKPDFQQLRFIQGIRFYNMLLIIFCHTACSYSGGYVANTDYFELVYRNEIRLYVATLFVFLVQTFFLLSAFLLSYHVCQSMVDYKGSKIRYLLVTFLNRYLRILPPVLVMIMFSVTVWIPGMFQGPVHEIYAGQEFQRCLKNWWTNLLFINNHYRHEEMCYLITWYLAADTQLYFISLLILLAIWKYPQYKQKHILIGLILVGILFPAINCYKYGLDIVYRLTPENSKSDKFRSFKFNLEYMSTTSNMASYMVGLALGTIYHAMQTKVRPKMANKYYNMVIFTVIPISVVYVASHEHSPLLTALLAGVVRPLYAAGIGAGILAMSQQKNGIIKRICEFKPVLFFGNFTYSTYVVQYGIVFYRTVTAREPMFVSDGVLVASFMVDAVWSIFFGFLMHILVEMPALQLQKMYVPQIRHRQNELYKMGKGK